MRGKKNTTEAPGRYIRRTISDRTKRKEQETNRWVSLLPRTVSANNVWGTGERSDSMMNSGFAYFIEKVCMSSRLIEKVGKD